MLILLFDLKVNEVKDTNKTENSKATQIDITSKK